jgi:flavin-dependent dehydrogenase
MSNHFDVVIVGGGPGGSTLAGMLLKYQPKLKVLIIEREKFPREHVGESQLPQVSAVLNELGIWDQVERAGFPVKIGGTYKWGQGDELWDFNFIPPEAFEGQVRPGKYEGVRHATAFQVDRAQYDDLLLRHAEKLGCTVWEGVAVRDAVHENDTIHHLNLSNGEKVTARYYVDASGHVGVLRRSLGVEIDCPTVLKNIAIWDYWNNTGWADTIGSGGTRVQVISVGYGWLWFIPITPTRTSLGLVCPVNYYKSANKSPEQLYTEAIAASQRITGFLEGATRENVLRTTNDWSFVSERIYGKNWFLVGECAGFADPILSAGLTLTQVGGRELAYTIIALDEGKHDAEWLKSHYQQNQQKRVRQHMRFAEFWYAANGQFTDLREHCREIAKESGLTLSAQKAWAWLAQGGFTNDVLGQAVIGGFDLTSLNQVTQRFMNEDLHWQANDRNIFRLQLNGATKTTIPDYRQGAIVSVPCYERNSKRLAITGVAQVVLLALSKASDIQNIMNVIQQLVVAKVPQVHHGIVMEQALQVLEVLVAEGWVAASLDESLPRLNISSPRDGELIKDHSENWTRGHRNEMTEVA